MTMHSPHLPAPRTWYPFPLVDRQARAYRVSFRIAEEATWDHRFHDPNGQEISAEELTLLPSDQLFIQSRCDNAVGARTIVLNTFANSNGAGPTLVGSVAADPA